MKILHTLAILILCSTFEVWQPAEKHPLSTAKTSQSQANLDSTRSVSLVQPRTVSAQEVNAPPFAEVLGIERIRLAEPIQFRGRDGVRPETDFILIAVRIEFFLRLTERGIGPDEIMLNDEPVEYLWFPETNLALIAPVPTGPLDQADLWIAPFSSKKADTLESVKELRARASKRGSARLLSLGPSIRAGLAITQIRQFANRKELQDHARDLIKRRAKPISVVQG